MADLASLYRQKEDSYFATPRDQLIRLIDGTGLKVLDVGCGVGDTGRRLLESGKAKWVTGIELIPEKAAVARSVLNEVHIGDIEEMHFDWNRGEFDCFVFGDVLEHTGNPWNLVRRLKPFLADDGIAVASIPNVKYFSVVANLLLFDDWRYAESGVLDITHLRFFTRKTAVRVFSKNGYSVERIEPLFTGRRYSILNQATLGMFSGFLSQCWLMRLRA